MTVFRAVAGAVAVVVAAAVAVLVPTADASASTVQGPPPPSEALCTSTGGTVVAYQYFDAYGHRFGIPARMCHYRGKTPHDPFGVADISLATLYSPRPTLAALAYYARVAPTGAGDPTPAKAYCAYIGGQPTLTGYYARGRDGGQIGLCRFEDGSFMEEWTLLYNAAGEPRGIDLTTVMRWSPRTAS